jgi:type IV secretory pathway TraG/TraD family ATPase VirD4
MNPILNLTKILHYSRGLNVRFTIFTRGYRGLISKYGESQKETIKASFANIMYLYSNDLDTLEEISRQCGNIKESKPLITVEELKTIKAFETIILRQRMRPFKTKLLPYWKTGWNKENIKKYQIPKIKKNNQKIYNINL